MTTPAEFTVFFPPGFQTTPGQISVTSAFSKLKGVQSLGNVVNQRLRYGFEDTTESNFETIPATFACQATNFVKSVKLKGYVGNTVITESQTWLRVYREVWYPSTTDKYQNYAKGKSIFVPRPKLPNVSYGTYQLPLFGQGSIPDDPYAVADGQYVLLWLRWDGIAKTPYGVLFDWYWSGSTDLEKEPIYLNQTPANSGGKSKSRTNDFVSNGINSTYSEFGINGYYLANYSPNAGQAGARYFLQDDTENPKPVLQTSRSITINVPNIIKERVDFGATKIGLFDNAPTSTIQPVGAMPGQYVTGIAGTSLPGYKFSKLVLNIEPYNYLLAVDEDTEFKIRRHLDLSQQVNFDLSQTGGKKIIGSGSGQNYIEPNIKFGFTPNSGSIWEVNPVSDSTTLPVAVVDGTNLGNLAAPADNKWIPGYAPATDSPADRATARQKYWYVLPLQSRSFQGGGCLGQKSEFTSTQAANNFTSPNASCYQGLHFGKFLKSTVNAVGFSDNQIIANYIGAINEKAKAELSNNLINTKLVGYYAHGGGGASRTAPKVSQITFTLAGVKGFEGGSKQTFPTSSSSSVGTSGNNPQFSTGDSTTDSPGTQSFTGPPKDWKKILTDATARLISGSTIEKLNPNQLSKFLSNRLSEGAPLSLLKNIVLESILSAKLTVLQASGTNRKAALAILKNDPLYQSLVVAVNTTKIPPKTSGNGGTLTGSTDSSNSQNETRTIRINVVRGLPGYRPDIRPTASISGQPELVQTFSVMSDTDNVSVSKPRRFVFPFVPREVNYSGIGAQWTEITRSGNYPIVDWTGFNLLKISFNFDIVDTKYRGIQGFGLNFSCEDQIRTLREMAQTPYPVTFLNMDKFMQNEVRWPLLSSGRGIEFVIAEFSVTAVQRTGGGTIKDGSDSNQISRASCSMTLQEIPIETVEIVQMPAIKPCKKNCTDDKITKEKLNKYLLFTAGKAGI